MSGSALDQQPPPNGNSKARRPLFVSPLIRDWTFWLFVVVAAVGGSQSAYRTASRFYSLEGTGASLGAASIDILAPLLFGFLVFAVVPAFLRKLFLIPRDRKAWSSVPSDSSAGWKADPARIAQNRWWNGSHWSNDVLPHRKIGRASIWVLVALLALVTVAFLAGAGSRAANPDQSSTQGELSGQEVGPGFQQFVTALSAYGKIQPDEADPLSKFTETETAYTEMSRSYLTFKAALAAVNQQEDLGPQAPDLMLLRNLVTVADPYMDSQDILIQAVSKCASLAGGLSSPNCDLAQLEILELRVRATIPPFVEAMDAVMNSTPLE